nr:hypothetical protein [Mycobacterium tilburgii]
MNARDEAARLGREAHTEDRPFANSFVTAIKGLPGWSRRLRALPEAFAGRRLRPAM